jgi:hypothetical protein
VGDVTVVAFGVLTLVGLALVGFGALRRARILLVAGSGLLLALAGAWTLGLPGAAVGGGRARVLEAQALSDRQAS